MRTDCYMLTGSVSCCYFELLCSPLTLSSFLNVSCVCCPPLALILTISAGKDHLVQGDSCKTQYCWCVILVLKEYSSAFSYWWRTKFMLLRVMILCNVFITWSTFNIVLCCYMQHVIIDNLVYGKIRYFFELFSFVKLCM